MKQLFKIRGFLVYTIMLFINAFVDLGHKIIVQNTVFKIYDGQTQVILTAIVNALILLPFIALFSPAGFLSDKYPKHLVMRYSAWAAVFAVMLITLSYYEGWFWCAYALTFALGIQAAIYSPAKYGFIRELVGDQHLAQGNGVVQAVTIVAILCGTFVFSALFEGLLKGVTIDNSSTIVHVIAPIGWLLVGLTVIELWLSYQLPAMREVDDEKKFSAVDYLQGDYLKQNLTSITTKHVIWLSIIGLSMFWAISQVVLASFPAYAKEVLSETNTLVIQGILACTGFGIIAGSLIAGEISRDTIEMRLVYLGMAGFTVALGFMPSLETRVAMGCIFMALGFFGGLFIVPLNALIQHHAKADELGRVLAGNNWMQNIAMLGSLLLTIVFASFGITSVQLFYILMLASFAGTFYVVYKLDRRNEISI